MFYMNNLKKDFNHYQFLKFLEIIKKINISTIFKHNYNFIIFVNQLNLKNNLNY